MVAGQARQLGMPRMLWQPAWRRRPTAFAPTVHAHHVHSPWAPLHPACTRAPALCLYLKLRCLPCCSQPNARRWAAQPDSAACCGNRSNVTAGARLAEANTANA